MYLGGYVQLCKRYLIKGGYGMSEGEAGMKIGRAAATSV